MESFWHNILFLPAAISVLVVNSFVTSYAATKLGDPTPRIKGRLSLSPRAHLDMVGLLFFVITGFCWINPLEINPRYFKKQKLYSVITVLSGVLANFAFSFFAYILYKILSNMSLGNLGESINFVLLTTSSFSVRLGLFHLFPFPPLNGFLIFEKFLPRKYFSLLSFFQQYGFLVLIFLSIVGVTNAIISPLYNAIYGAIVHTVNFLFYLL